LYFIFLKFQHFKEIISNLKKKFKKNKINADLEKVLQYLHIGAIYMKKYLKAKEEELWKLKIFHHAKKKRT
jgi:hypothetical protein